MRLVQSGYERCAADYQTRIKALNAQTSQVIWIPNICFPRIFKSWKKFICTRNFDETNWVKKHAQIKIIKSIYPVKVSKVNFNEHEFFSQWDCKVTKIWNLLLHRIWKIVLLQYYYISQEEEQGSYYDDSLYAYEYEYAEGGDYVEDVPEDQQLNQLERKRKRRSANHPTSQHQLKRRQSEDYTTQGDSEENVKLLCCSFQKYLHCSESVVNTTCGYETAQFTKSFLDRMSGPLIQVVKGSLNRLLKLYSLLR